MKMLLVGTKNKVYNPFSFFTINANHQNKERNTMKKEYIFIAALIGIAVTSLSACARKCPPCQPTFVQTQSAPQVASQPAEESVSAPRLSQIK